MQCLPASGVSLLWGRKRNAGPCAIHSVTEPRETMEIFAAIYGPMILAYAVACHACLVQTQKIDVRLERLKLDLQSSTAAGDSDGIARIVEELRFVMTVKEKITGFKTIEKIEKELRYRRLPDESSSRHT